MKFYHIFLGAFAFSFLAHAHFDIEAGPIWSNEHAQEVCPEVCSGEAYKWEGEWHTTTWGEMSVCTCADSHDHSQRQDWQQSWQQADNE